MRLQASLALASLCLSVVSAGAQAYDERRANIVSVGLGGRTGGAGVAYRRLLSGAPIAFSVGYGAWGPAIGAELTFSPGSTFLPSNTDPAAGRLSLAVAAIVPQDWQESAGEVVVAFTVASQLWPGENDRFFIEGGIGILTAPFGELQGEGTAPVVFRLQMGAGF